MTPKYTWEWVKENWDVAAGRAAERHASESGHDGQFLLTGQTITCVHPACEPQWQHRPNQPDTGQ